MYSKLDEDLSSSSCDTNCAVIFALCSQSFVHLFSNTHFYSGRQRKNRKIPRKSYFWKTQLLAFCVNFFERL